MQLLTNNSAEENTFSSSVLQCWGKKGQEGGQGTSKHKN